MSEKWFDATREVQAKGPFDTEEEAKEYGFDLPEDVASDGFYVILERDGYKRPIGADQFETRFNFDKDTDQ